MRKSQKELIISLLFFHSVQQRNLIIYIEDKSWVGRGRDNSNFRWITKIRIQRNRKRSWRWSCYHNIWSEIHQTMRSRWVNILRLLVHWNRGSRIDNRSNNTKERSTGGIHQDRLNLDASKVGNLKCPISIRSDCRTGRESDSRCEEVHRTCDKLANSVACDCLRSEIEGTLYLHERVELWEVIHDRAFKNRFSWVVYSDNLKCGCERSILRGFEFDSYTIEWLESRCEWRWNVDSEWSFECRRKSGWVRNPVHEFQFHVFNSDLINFEELRVCSGFHDQRCRWID